MKAKTTNEGVAMAAVASESSVRLRLVPVWKPALQSYQSHELTGLEFGCDSEANKAIELLWKDELHGCPFTFTPDGGVVVPTDAVAYFRKARLKFTEHQVES